VWSGDVSGGAAAPFDDEASSALHGGVVSKLTYLNSDPNDVGPRGG
jgi:hypothetical protein